MAHSLWRTKKKPGSENATADDRGSLVAPCPPGDDGSGCVKQCEDGYKGALCAECLDGYYKSSGNARGATTA